MMDEMGGLLSSLPLVGGVTAFAAFANLGLPVLAGFPGEFFTLAGSFPVFTAGVIVAASGLVLTAGYHLRMMQRVLMGQPRALETRVDLAGRELAVAAPLMVFIVLLGVMPGLALSVFNAPIAVLAAKLGGI